MLKRTIYFPMYVGSVGENLTLILQGSLAPT